jgi:Putative zinc-finger
VVNDVGGCKKYVDWMTDAALGELAPERERDLMAHIAGCEGCRKAYEQARQFAVMVDRAVQSLVAGEPSPQFAARLRSEIADERRAPRFAWFAWKPAAAALAVAAVIALFFVFRAPEYRNPARRTTKSGRDMASVGTAASPANPVTNLPAGSPANLRAHRSLSARVPTGGGGPGEVSVARLVPRRHAARRANSPAEPEVIVPPGQLEAIMKLVAEIRSGRLDGKQLIAAQKELSKPLQIDSIQIPPLAKPQPYLYPSSDAYPSSDVAPDQSER